MAHSRVWLTSYSSPTTGLRAGENESSWSYPALGNYLFVGEALVSEDFQQGGSIAVPPFEHLPHDAKQVPDALRLPAPQRAQQTCPFSGGWRLRGRQIHGVHVTVKGAEREMMTRALSSLFSPGRRGDPLSQPWPWGLDKADESATGLCQKGP